MNRNNTLYTIIIIYSVIALLVANTALALKPPMKLKLSYSDTKQKNPDTDFYEAVTNKGEIIKCYIAEDGSRYAGRFNKRITKWKNYIQIKRKMKKKYGKGSSKFKKVKKKARRARKACKTTDPPSQGDDSTDNNNNGGDNSNSADNIEGLVCGNGVVELKEECDDGNTTSGDGCSAVCENELCGDGSLDLQNGEECDDGNLLDGDGCSAECRVEGQKLTPGNGFTSSGTEPDPIGSSSDPGYTAKVIAKWNVVPYQTIYNKFNVGVVAFHINGIDRVDFSVEGGDFASVKSSSLNPRTNTYEYWATIDPAEFKDGKIEVRAIAYPKNAGKPVLLPSLYLYVNSGGTLPAISKYVSVSGSDELGDGSVSNPYKTIAKAVKAIANQSNDGTADGGFIFLSSGNHVYGGYTEQLAAQVSDRWITILPYPNASKSSVILNADDGTPGLKLKRVRLKNLTIRTDLPTDPQLEDYLWIDGSDLVWNGADVNVSTDGFISDDWSGYYLTDASVSSNAQGVGGKLLRNVTLSSIGNNALTGSEMVINTTIDQVGTSGNSLNTYLLNIDTDDEGGNINNRIFYNVKATNVNGQGIVAQGTGSIDNIAFVNVLIDQKVSDIVFSMWQGVTSNHILFWNITADQEFQWRVANSSLENISWFGNSVLGMSVVSPADSSILDNHEVAHNHYVKSDSLVITPGSDVTTGSAGYVDEENGDFSLQESSPLKTRISTPKVPIDIENNLRGSEASIGAYE